ncbi:MAG: hypothetical protein V3S04_04425 [Candidatus Omnitrophota bacterium]
MGKALGRAVLAVLVTALGAAVIRKRYPELPKKVTDGTVELVNNVKDSIKDLTSAAIDAFKEGYASARTRKV